MLQKTYELLESVKGSVLLGLVGVFGFDDFGEDLLQASRSFRYRAIAHLRLLVVGHDQAGAVKGRANLQRLARLDRLRPGLEGEGFVLEIRNRSVAGHSDRKADGAGQLDLS